MPASTARPLLVVNTCQRGAFLSLWQSTDAKKPQSYYRAMRKGDHHLLVSLSNGASAIDIKVRVPASDCQALLACASRIVSLRVQVWLIKSCIAAAARVPHDVIRSALSKTAAGSELVESLSSHPPTARSVVGQVSQPWVPLTDIVVALVMCVGAE